MIVLGLDTALPACSVAILDGDRVLASASEPMLRGHQERLAPMVQGLMSEAGLAFGDLHRIASTVGPGSFTGLRVGLSFAKAMALALDIPCVGVGSLAAVAASEDAPGLKAAVIDAKRGQVYLQVFAGDRALTAPAALDLDMARARLAEAAGGSPMTLIGSGAVLVADVLPGSRIVDRIAPDPAAIARLGAALVPVPPRPLYLRAPDAKLPGGRDP